MSEITTQRPADRLVAGENRESKPLQSGAIPDPLTTPIDQIDVSDSRLYQQDIWRPFFKRLREEDPVHYTEDSPFGPYWSITRFQDIINVETHHDVFSSFPTIVIGDSPNGENIENFIAMDPPRHDQQRSAVSGD